MKKKKNNASYTLAFLDVLSNAMAAVLIITMVKMKPYPAGDYYDGLYSITVEHLDQRNMQNIGIAIRQKGKTQFLHESEAIRNQNFRLIKYNHNSAKLLFFGKPRQDEIDEIFCYVVDPIPIKTENIRIIINFPGPGGGQIREEKLNAKNQYRHTIIKNDEAN